MVDKLCKEAVVDSNQPLLNQIYLQRGKEKLLCALDEDIITVGRASARAPVIPLSLITGAKHVH